MLSCDGPQRARLHADAPSRTDPEMKRVYGWRHALQRGFLPKDGKIKEEVSDTRASSAAAKRVCTFATH